jgi:hypothetical protein
MAKNEYYTPVFNNAKLKKGKVKLNLKKVIILVGPSYSMCPLNLM